MHVFSELASKRPRLPWVVPGSVSWLIFLSSQRLCVYCASYVLGILFPVSTSVTRIHTWRVSMVPPLVYRRRLHYFVAVKKFCVGPTGCIREVVTAVPGSYNYWQRQPAARGAG